MWVQSLALSRHAAARDIGGTAHLPARPVNGALIAWVTWVLRVLTGPSSCTYGRRVPAEHPAQVRIIDTLCRDVFGL